MRKTWLIYAAMVPLTLLVAAAQLFSFRHLVPGPDSIAYFEMAGQIARQGYAEAVSDHWSPLYGLYLFAVGKVFGHSLQQEQFTALAANAVLYLACFAAAFMFIRSLGRRLWPDDARFAAWAVYGLALAFFLLFGFTKIHLLLPDSMVFIGVTLNLWAWCHAFQNPRQWRWVVAAAVFGGLSYWARANLLHWSLSAAFLACLLCPEWRLGRRLAAAALFCLVLAVVVAPQAAVLSEQKGGFTLGAGKVPFAEIYGAEWKEGYGRWPLRMADGDVRVFTDQRQLNFPGFYDPGREYEDAIISFRWRLAVRGFLRAMHSLLFGFWSSSFALLWPLLWATWPFFLFVPALGKQRWTPDDSTAWFLTLAGLAGIGMHLLSFCTGYYLPPYLFPFLTGIAILALNHSEDTNRLGRALALVAAGFICVTCLSTLALFRDASRQSFKQGHSEMVRLAQALGALPRPDGQLRKVAVAGNWLGLYGVRLSGSQVYADVPDASAFADAPRLARILEVLKEEEVVVLLAQAPVAQESRHLDWKKIDGTSWYLLSL